MIASELHAAVAAVAPIQGVSIGRRTDKATWRIDFEDAATESERQAAAAVMSGFDPQSVSPPSPPAPPQAPSAPMSLASLSMSQILSGITEEPPAPLTLTREVAICQVGDEEAAITARLGSTQLIYETAIQAKNGSVPARGLLEPEAIRRGIAIDAYADEVIADRGRRVIAATAVASAAARHRAALTSAAPENLSTMVRAAIAELRSLEG